MKVTHSISDWSEKRVHTIKVFGDGGDRLFVEIGKDLSIARNKVAAEMKKYIQDLEQALCEVEAFEYQFSRTVVIHEKEKPLPPSETKTTRHQI